MAADHSLSPSDVAVALRSFPRRFRAALERPDDEERVDPDEIGRRVGPDGTSAADHLLAADGILALLDAALDQARRADDVVLHPAFGDLASATWADDHSPTSALLDQFDATAARAATAADAVTSDRWGASTRVADHDGGASLLTVTQDAVGAVAGHLRSAQKVIDAVI